MRFLTAPPPPNYMATPTVLLAARFGLAETELHRRKRKLHGHEGPAVFRLIEILIVAVTQLVFLPMHEE